jgi:hypothetical protein
MMPNDGSGIFVLVTVGTTPWRGLELIAHDYLNQIGLVEGLLRKRMAAAEPVGLLQLEEFIDNERLGAIPRTSEVQPAFWLDVRVWAWARRGTAASWTSRRAPTLAELDDAVARGLIPRPKLLLIHMRNERGRSG